VPANISNEPAKMLGTMAEDPVKARFEPEPVDPPAPDESVPAPDVPVVLASAAAESALEEPLALDFAADVVVVVPDAPAAAAASSWFATRRPAVSMAEVAGAAPKLSMSVWPFGPRTNRIKAASAVSFAAVSPLVGTTR